MKLRYVGHDSRYYPDVVIPGEGSLVAHPGDERELEANPDETRWIEVEPEPDKPEEPEPAEPEPPVTGGLITFNPDQVTVGE